MANILRQQDTLKLTSMQADSIAVMNRRYQYRADSIWAVVSKYFGTLGAKYDPDGVYDRFLEARRAQIDMLMRIGPAVNALLTPEQRRKLPQGIVNSLDPRFLLSIRNGTNTFVGGGNNFGGPVFFNFGGGDFFIR
jgi:hypothetical protein